MQAAWLWPVYELLPRLWEWGWLHEDWTPPHSTSNWTPCSFNVLHSCIKFMSYLQLVNEGFPWKISVYECLLCTASVNFTWTDVPGKPMKKSSPASGKWKHRDLEVLGMGILPQHNDNVMACPLRGESCSFCETHHLRDALVGKTETQLHKGEENPPSPLWLHLRL